MEAHISKTVINRKALTQFYHQAFPKNLKIALATLQAFEVYHSNPVIENSNSVQNFLSIVFDHSRDVLKRLQM